jgi:uncharacterized protein YprB with RNaseH-like and TPR domain
MSALTDRLRAVLGPPQGGPHNRLGPPERGPHSRLGPPDGGPYADGDVDGCGGRLPPARDHAADVLGGQWRDASGQRFLVVDRTYLPGHRHGRMAMADALPSSDGVWPTLSLLVGGHARPAVADPPAERLLFVDLETTGLAGGAGTYAFLVGCAWFDGGSFRIRQFFLTSFSAERALLEAVAEVAGDASTVVTYNGKTFDLPLMETRFVLHRKATPFSGMPHLDMLHPARRLWRGDDEGCSLTTIERTLCGHVREGDVPGFEIPARYFHYVRSGDAVPLGAVFEHNRLDLLSLAFLTARAAQLLDEGPAGAGAAREAIGLGRLYERGGRLREARACFARAIALEDGALEDGALEDGALDNSTLERYSNPRDEGRLAEALRAYAVVSRRLRCYEDAAVAWRRVAGLHACPPTVVREATEALAVHHEHRMRDPRTARAFALRSLSCHGTPARAEALQHRLARLNRKLGDEEAGALF